MPTGVGKRLRLLAALAATSVFALAACGSNTEDDGAAAASGTRITVKHAQGETEIPVNPKKVISFDMPSVDTLNELNVEVAGLPKDNLPDFLSKYKDNKYVDAGTLFEPNYEAVNAAQPDLIIVGGRSAAAYEKLSQIAPTIDLTINQKDWLNSFTEVTKTLGRIFQREAAADEALQTINSKIEKVKAQAANKGTGLIVLTTGGKVSAYGPGSRFGIIHDVLGVTPAESNVKSSTHGESISFEYIRDKNPDWLFVVDRDAATGEKADAAKKVLDNALVAKTKAWQSNQVIYLDPVRWYIVGAGLSTVNAMIDQIQNEMA